MLFMLCVHSLTVVKSAQEFLCGFSGAVNYIILIPSNITVSGVNSTIIVWVS